MKKFLSVLLTLTMVLGTIVSFETLSYADGFLTSGGWYESVYATWNGTGSASDYEVYYKKSTDSVYTKADEELIRQVDGVYRVDIPGLVKNTDYDIKMVNGNSEYTATVKTDAYDRSGYAHFKYTEGVGAYNDDGTPKDNAIIVYVTDSNKDSVTVPGYEGTKGIGWILNNNPGLLKTITSEHPLIIRIVGKVNPPKGLTGANSTENGGNREDNGNMAILKDAKNITVEGIGYDSHIYNWGISFKHTAACTNGGKNYEVRNITFSDYPEDAIGIEGEMNGDNLVAPIERTWIHNNTFYKGSYAGASAADKKDGDGSCDFKRGQYYTLSYNYFQDCHKTNLIGANDDNKQYNITLHHNYWNTPISRTPLVRQANLHFYNNYLIAIYDNGVNARANAYVFSEGNYFGPSNSPYETNSGALIKTWKDVIYGCKEAEGMNIQIAKTRDEYIQNSNIYPDFDTNPEVFYYDAVNKCSDVERLTDAVTAKAECLAYSGAMKKDLKKAELVSIIENKPSKNLSLPYSIDFTTSDAMTKVQNAGLSQIPMQQVTEIDGIVYNLYKEFKASSSYATVRTQSMIFTIDKPCEITIKDGNYRYPAVLVSEFGDVVIKPSLGGTASAVVPAGTYMIETNNHEKSSGLASLTVTPSSSLPETTTKVTTETTTQITTQTTTKETTTQTTTQQPQDILYGDTNNDGSITASDAATVLAKVLNADYLISVDLSVIDVDNSNSVTSADASSILQKTLNSDFKFKVEQ